MTIREALAEGTAALVAAPDTSGITNPRLDASLLLASILNMSRSSLIAADSQPLAGASLAAFRALLKRRLDGECVAYILGKKEFYGLDFQVNPAVLVPRPDTETLVEAALGIIRALNEVQRQAVFIGKGSTARAQEKAAVCRKWRACFSKLSGRWEGASTGDQPMRVLDLCTGSGAVAVALKHTMPELEMWATDISAEALEVARANAARLLPADSIHFCHSDLFGALSSSFPLIISNPPYIPTAEIAGLAPEVRGEPLLALDGGDDGLDIIRRIISGAPEFLFPGGILLLEADSRQMGQITALLHQAGFTDIQTHSDLSGKKRVIAAKKPAT